MKFINKYKKTVCKYLNWMEFQIPAFRAFCKTAVTYVLCTATVHTVLCTTTVHCVLCTTAVHYVLHTAEEQVWVEGSYGELHGNCLGVAEGGDQEPEAHTGQTLGITLCTQL